MFSNLHVELINLILSFEGSLKYRNGKWMNPLLDLPKEIKDTLSNCIKIKYKSIIDHREIVVWSVAINTYKRLSLFIRKEMYSRYSNPDYIGLTEYIGEYHIINYKSVNCHRDRDYPRHEITTFDVIW